MQTATTLNNDAANDSGSSDATTSAVAWPAIIAGAVTAAAVSLILLLLGSGLGLASVSPWSNSGVTVATFTVTTAIWLIVMQWISSGLGGYLTGRLRSKWVSMHTDEVFFRDTAHGFLAWSLATVITAAFLASAASSIIGGGVKVATTVYASAGAGVVSSAAKNPNDTIGDPMAYFVDSLYRSENLNPSEGDIRGETARILVTDLKDGSVSDADKAYLTQLVSARTGLNLADASKRVDDVIAKLTTAKEKAKEEIETARKSATHIAIYIFLSMLIGAFIASAAAALGGRQRDEY